jgi:uncharacterized protein YjbJ (UPF0337 family)
MDMNRILGSAKQITGSIKLAVGKLFGDAKLQFDGKTEEATGKAQNLLGSIRDSVKK